MNDSNLSIRSQIYTEQVAYLYHHASLTFIFSIVNGFLLAYLQRTVISLRVLSIWFILLLLVTLARSILVYFYHQKYFHNRTTAQWHRAYITGTALAGCVWGSAAIFLFPEGELGHQLFVVFVLAGMTAAAVPVLAVSLVAFFLFALPTLLPLSIQVFWHGESLSTPMGIMVLFYVLGLSISARRLNRTVLSSFRVRFDNHELVKEIAERQTAEEALYQQKERLQITFSAMAEGVIITTVNGLIEYLNPAAEKMSGWLNPDAIGKKVEQVFSNVDESSGEFRHSAIHDCQKNAARANKNNLLLAKNGEQRTVEEVATPLKDSTGKIVGTVAIIRDVTLASEHSRQLSYQASHDSLTGLPNRSLLCDRLEHAIAKAIRADCYVAVMFMDLDRFKQINDSLGHAAGDILLRNVAEKLRASVRQEDTVSRLGGDEFVLVLEDLVDQDQAKRVAQKIVDNLAKPIIIEDQEISVSVSIGIAVFPRDGKNVETLLKNADVAMYRTKELAQGNIQFFTGEMSARALNRLKMEQRLQQVVARNELELYYQPRVSMDSDEIVGHEALVRWRTSPNTLVSPAEFIHIAEEAGSILRIGEWVLRTACEQAKSWCDKGHLGLRSICQCVKF
ncbi:MAG: diguanylate cyclase [Methylococcaceae bacterium]